MPIDYQKLLNYQVPPVEQTLTKRDTMLYALGVGLGADPCDTQQLQFVYEDGLKALPTMAIILGYAGAWFGDPQFGITRNKSVHGEQGFVIHRPLPVEGRIIGRSEVAGVIDKGPGKGALLLTKNHISDATTGEAICTLTHTLFCRADGGFGGPTGPLPRTHAIPETAPDAVCDLPTLPQAALIYRLSGDYNPLHADPAYAKTAGFDKPILHGRATFSVAGHAILKTCCGYDPARLKAMEGRFSSPVFPGDTIRTEMWVNGKVVTFRATVPARNVTVLNNGRAELA